MTGKKTQMIMELPEDLLTEVDACVLEGKVQSRDEFFERAALSEARYPQTRCHRC
jgi:metal-responsive CopG/Arc/MetJ family transcriptional regulator